jgi:type I restriction enzyme S subunit
VSDSALPASWTDEPLGTRIDVLNGFAFDSERFSTKGGEALIRIRDLKAGRTETRYTGPFDERYVVSDGDYLIGMDGEFGCYRWNGGRALLNQRVCKLVLKERADLRFVAYGLGAYLKQIEDDTSFTTVKHLSARQIREIRFGFPSLEEQRRIADRLDAAMADVSTARAALAYQQAQTTTLETAALEAALGGRVIAASDDQGVAGPDWVALSDVAKLESGHTPSRKRSEWWGGDVPWIALPDIRALDGKAALETEEQTNALGLANSSARLLPAGTVVLSRTASVGFVTVMGVPMATSQDFANWVPGEKLRSWYLAHALIAARGYIRGLAEGAIHKTIYMPTLKGLRIRLPSVNEQDRVLGQIDEASVMLQRATDALDRQVAALEALAPALLAAAFQGNL